MALSQSNDQGSEPVRRRNAERTRAVILASAMREFSQFGYAGARIDRIAKAAKCNIRMLYHYFGTKQDLYKGVLERAYADLRQRESTLVIDMEQPLEGLLELTRFTFLYFDQNPHFEGLIRAENIIHGRFVSQLRPVVEGASPLKKMISDLIASGQAKGLFRAGLDPVQVYVTITALSRFHLGNAFTMSAVMDADLRDKEWRKRRLEHALDLLQAYLTSDSGGVAAAQAET
jgi:AcrR family transcriptional regulator